ncbi:MAG: type II secretion system protein [Dehalococcoidia bacterium]
MKWVAALRSVVREDRGVSLIEAMIAVTILGIAAGGLMWGLLGFVVESGRVEQRSDANQVLIGFTEAVRVQAPYLPQTCPASPGETSTPYDPDDALLSAWGVELPDGWDASTIDVEAPVRYWDSDLGAFVPMPTGDSEDEVLQCARLLQGGLQQIAVRVTSPDSRATESMAIVKRVGS